MLRSSTFVLRFSNLRKTLRCMTCFSINHIPKYIFVAHRCHDAGNESDLLILEKSIRHGRYGEDWDRKDGSEKKSNYNFGLTGKGKSVKTRTIGKIQVKGEIIFGLYPVYYALLSRKREIYSLILKENRDSHVNSVIDLILDLSKKQNLLIKRYSVSTLDHLSCNRPHQGVCLDVSKKEYILETNLPLVDKSPQLWVYLQSIQDPMNMGAVLRSSYYFGVNNILVSKSMSCPLSPVVSKSSAGVMELIDIHSVHNIKNAIANRRRNNEKWTVVGSVASDNQNAIPIEEIKIDSHVLLLVGNEGSGLSEDVLELCDQLVTIHKSFDNDIVFSLNVSVATGIILTYLRKHFKNL